MKHPNDVARFWQIAGLSICIIALIEVVLCLFLINDNYVLREANKELSKSYTDAYNELQQTKNAIGYGCIARVPGELVSLISDRECKKWREE